MAQTATSFVQFEKTYTVFVDNWRPGASFSVKKLSKKEWQNAHANTVDNKAILTTPRTNGTTTLTQISIAEETYTTVPKGKVGRLGQTISASLQFNGQFHGLKKMLTLQVTEWKPEEVRLVSASELWLKVKLLYLNDNGDRVIEKTTPDYIRLLLPFDEVEAEEMMNNTAYLGDANGTKYLISILPLGSAIWGLVAKPVVLLHPGDSLLKETTVMSDFKVKEDKQYICALPLDPNQRSISRFVYSLTIEFSIKGLIKGRPISLKYTGNEWVPQSAYFHSTQELWLEVKKIVNVPDDNKQKLSEKSYYIKLSLPFNGAGK